MKTVLMAIAIFCSVAAAAIPNEKVLQNFNTSFPKADSIMWYEGEKEYNVYFVNNGVRCRAWYDEEGNVKKSIRYYEANGLPPMIIGKLHSNYPKLKVFGVTECATTDAFTYEIVLEDEKKWYFISSDAAGSLTMIKKLNKASQ